MKLKSNFREAKEALQNGDIKHALNLYRKIQNQYPELSVFAQFNIDRIKKNSAEKNELALSKNNKFREEFKKHEFSAGSFYEMVKNKIKSKTFKTISFDFFDTLVYRDTEMPTDIFYLLGKKIIESGGVDVIPSAEAFREYRILAEKKSRENVPNGEVSIDEIYEVLSTFFPKINTSYVAKLERDFEAKHLIPLHSTFFLLKLAKENNLNVIVNSDTYFSPDDLYRFVPENYQKLIDKIYTSSSMRKGKASGSFDYILSSLEICPNEMFHCGDNYEADVRIPASRGIDTLLLPNGTNELCEIRNREVNFYRFRNQSNAPVTVGKLSTVDQKVSHFFNVESPWGHYSYGLYVLGPIFVAYVDWALENITERDGNAIFPLMREGYLLGRIIEELKPDGVEVFPLYLNRKILIQASLSDMSLEAMSALFGNALSSDFDKSLSLLNLSVDDFDFDIKSEIKYNYDGALQKIFRSKQLKSLAVDRANLLRKKIIRHIKNQLGGEILPKSFDLLDLGWNGTIQRNLAKIFELEGIDSELVGHYLMTTPAAVSPPWQVHSKLRGFLLNCGSPINDFELLMRNLEILEQSCSPRHGTVMDYDSSGSPIIAEVDFSNQKWVDHESLQKGILDYAKFYLMNREPGEGGCQEQIEYLKCKLARAMHFPTDSEISLFKNWTHDDNLFGNPESFLMNVHVIDKGDISIDEIVAIPMTKVYWTGGTLGAIDQGLAELSLYMKNIPIDKSKLFFRR